MLPTKTERRGGAREISEGGKQRKSGAMTAYWQRRREEKQEEERRRREHVARVERLRRMQAQCQGYRPLSPSAMTDEEAIAFAARQAQAASATMRLRDTPSSAVRRMDAHEQALYAAAINSAIRFFNDNDEKHKRLIAYREECRRANAECERRRDELRHAAKTDVYII